MIKIENDWDDLLEQEFEKPYYKNLRTYLKEEYTKYTIYPNMYDIFNAFHYTPYKDIKVVIIGQDPYHGPNQAHGLCFSVKPEVSIPPSLVNIYKELKSDLGCYIPNHGYLKKWTDQGVLLINTVLTVRASTPNSHRGKGWEKFTDSVIHILNKRETPIVFLLWGANARSKKKMLTNSIHYIIESAHPSPLSAHRGFLGSAPFSKTNDFLTKNDLTPIDWQIENN